MLVPSSCNKSITKIGNKKLDDEGTSHKIFFLLSIPAIVGAALLDIVILDFLDFSKMYYMIR
jgi:hypothetical protein